MLLFLHYYNYFAIIHFLGQSLNLDNLVINLRHLAPKWQEIGIHLKFSAVDLKSIQERCKEVDSDYLVELFDKWLRSTDTPTWKNITDALDAMGEHEASQIIMDIISEGDCELHFKFNVTATK